MKTKCLTLVDQTFYLYLHEMAVAGVKWQDVTSVCVGSHDLSLLALKLKPQCSKI
jgi:hypothetical protein